tara:strand:- start:3406 stop:3657 length:252 start_codon:yes stop_codon:yes gene_type:complete
MTYYLFSKFINKVCVDIKLVTELASGIIVAFSEMSTAAAILDSMVASVASNAVFADSTVVTADATVNSKASIASVVADILFKD